MSKEEQRLFRRQMFIAALGAMLIICLPAWGSIYWMRTKDHFKLQNTISDEEFLRYQMLQEAKVRSWESLAKTNAEDIKDIEAHVEKLEEIQSALDEFLRKEFTTRGLNVLPEF